jgi:enamine deaminase RidA (YjgF/YER057c/UK114 family)
MTTAPVRHVNLSAWQGERGFSQAASVPVGGTRLVYLAGAGSEAGTGEPDAVGDIRGQCRSAWASIAAVLAAEGGTLADIVRLRSFVTDVRFLPDVTAVRKEVLGAPPYPPHTFLVVTALAHPHMLVEIEVDAVVHAAR